MNGAEAFFPLFFSHDKEGEVAIGIGDFRGQSGEVRNELFCMLYTSGLVRIP